jgi:hypothetical protein
MLRIENSCEIGDLIDEVCKKSGKGDSEVATAMFKTFIYPESTKTYISAGHGPIVKATGHGYDWLETALQEIFAELATIGVHGVYVTTPI